VKTFALESQRQPLEMAYLDIAPKKAPIGVVVLLHGKNFCAATWKESIKPLVAAGYRVIAPDQVGFCKSSKPERYQYSFAQLAANTHALLQQLQLGDVPVHLVGHSMGGMLAVRYALMFPQDLRSLSLVNPIGLEDWKALGVPWRSVDAWYAGEMNISYDSIRRYQLEVYYDGKWKPAYEPWARMQSGMYEGPGKQAVAWSQALASDMVFNQPVVYELKNAGADHAVHRPEGPHRDRARPGAACGEGDAGQLSGAGQSGGRGDSRRDAGRVRRTGPFAAGAGPEAVQQRVEGIEVPPTRRAPVQPSMAAAARRNNAINRRSAARHPATRRQ
jgi:pimeloyl-ACP methyl ester carboxylesterase